MKKLIVFFLFFGLIWLSSCKPPKEPTSYKVWEGEDVNEINNIPISAVWVKPWINGQGWFPYKSFDTVDELQEIMHYLREPEQYRDGQPFTSEENLILYFAPPHQPVWINFYLNEWSNEFDFSRGFSRKLYKLLTQKEQRGKYGVGFLQDHLLPIDIIWIKKDAQCKWFPYKSFNSLDERMEIKRRLFFPENENFTPDFVGNERLISYYPPFNPHFPISKPSDITPCPPVEITFTIDDSTKEVITKRGRSKQLYKLFTEKPPREIF